MSHLQTVQQIYQAFATGDVPAILGKLAPDVAWESWADHSAQRAGVPWLLPRTGRDGAAAFFQVVGTQLRIHDFRVLALMEGENQVAAEVTIDAELIGGGRFQDEEIHLWTFDAGGLVKRFRHYVDTAKHIAAAPK